MYYFLRWTSDPKGDVKRNFSGHMQAWYKTREEAYNDYEKEKANGRHLPYEPKYDPVEDMWNSDPEWGISGYLFYDENSFNDAMEKIKEIAWHHQDNNQQDLALFSANELGDDEGFDGEELFRDISFIKYVDVDDTYKDVFNNNINELIKRIIREEIRLIFEGINIPVSVGDEILTDKFKNKKTKVKSIGKNEKDDVTINDKPALKFRIPKKD